MPLKHVRVCVPCDAVRYAQCSVGCRVPDEGDPASWVQVEDDAETLSREPAEPRADQYSTPVEG